MNSDKKEVIKEGTILKVNGFSDMNIFINPPFEISKENQPINSAPLIELGIFFNVDIFKACFEELTEEELKQLKF